MVGHCPDANGRCSVRVNPYRNNGRKPHVPAHKRRLANAKRVPMYVRVGGRDWLV